MPVIATPFALTIVYVCFSAALITVKLAQNMYSNLFQRERLKRINFNLNNLNNLNNNE